MLEIVKMTEADIPAALKIEKMCFGDNWNSTPFASELKRSDCHYHIAREDSHVLGYCGYWLILEELHITIMAVDPRYQRRKIGQKILWAALKDGINNGAKWATLEVKDSNEAAQRLYEKFGFTVMGRRKNYYQRAREDALIMWTEELDSEDYQKILNEIHQNI